MVVLDMRWIVAFVIGVCVLVAVLFLKSDAQRESLPRDFDESQAELARRDKPGSRLPDELGRFHDRQWHYRIDYPADWVLADHSASSDMIRADIHQGDSVGLQIRVVPRKGAPFESFVTAYVNTFTEEMSGHWQGTIDDLAKEFGQFGHHRGCAVRMILTRGDGQRWLLKQYLWPAPRDADEVVVFQCGTVLKDQALGEHYLDSVAASFRFTDDR